MMYQRIFVPVDSSAPSNLALDEAIMLAKNLKAVLVMAHSVNLPASGRSAPKMLDSSEIDQPQLEAGRRTLQSAVERARTAGIETETLLLENRGKDVADMLLQAAQKAQAELIVMGTHGRSGIKHLLLGSVAEGVLRAAELPVLLVRNEG
jgi:nucleotide-binding universal stress UspA family protein